LYQALSYWAIRIGAYPTIARTRLTQGITSVIVAIVLYPLGSLALILGAIIGSAAGTSRLLALLRGSAGNLFRSTSRGEVWKAAYAYRRFPQMSALSGLINASGLQLPSLFMAALYGTGPVGQFALVQRIVGTPFYLIGDAVARVYMGSGAVASRSGGATLRSLYLRVSLHLSVLGACVAGGLILVGPVAIPRLFGSRWIAAGEYSRWLGVAVGCQLVASPLSQTLNILKKQSWGLIWDVWRLALILCVFLLSARAGLDAAHAVKIYSLAMAVAYVSQWGLGLLAACSRQQVADVPPDDQSYCPTAVVPKADGAQ
jgi:O-antigen/teichoic acid export membrane protein